MQNSKNFIMNKRGKTSTHSHEIHTVIRDFFCKKQFDKACILMKKKDTGICDVISTLIGGVAFKDVTVINLRKFIFNQIINSTTIRGQCF